LERFRWKFIRATVLIPEASVCKKNFFNNGWTRILDRGPQRRPPGCVQLPDIFSGL